jgi:hypothetical protein
MALRQRGEVAAARAEYRRGLLGPASDAKYEEQLEKLRQEAAKVLGVPELFGELNEGRRDRSSASPSGDRGRHFLSAVAIESVSY